MRKIIVAIFLVITFLCSCSNLNNTAKLKADDAIACSNRGIAYAKLGQYQRAIDDFNKAISLKLNDAKLYYNRGLAYDNLGKLKRAIEDYNKAISLKPDDASAYTSRGVLILCSATKIFSAVMCKKLVRWETAIYSKWLKASAIAPDSGGVVKLTGIMI